MSKKSNNQIKYGALISYLLIITNALFGILVTPFILKNLGSSSYGVYKTIGSLSSSLLILDLGIGGTLMRYIAKYRANEQDEKIGPFISIVMCETGIIIPVIAIIEIFLYSRLGPIYSESFTAAELVLAKQLFSVLAVTIVLNIIENFLGGIINGYNNFILGNGLKLIKLLLRIVLIVVLLPLTRSALLLVTINLILGIFGVIIQLTYIIRHYHIRLEFNRR